jgi:glycosyltransferase involved in cell wall biosynthesis
MVVRSDVAHDARVIREATTLADAGHEICVLGAGVPDGWTPPQDVAVVSLGTSSVFRRSAPRGHALTAPLKAARWALLPRHNESVNESFRRSVRTWAKGSVRFDVVHAHDMPMLPVAAELARAWGSALVYDSHEWWAGRRREQRPTPLGDLRESRLERRLALEADVVLTVSEGIAERFRSWGVPDVRVVRNTFPEQATAPSPVTDVNGLVYAGRIDASRDLDTLFRAAAVGLGLPVSLVGPTDTTFIQARRLPAGVTLRSAVEPDEVDALLRRAGVALVTLDDSCDNHRLALPNKLYQAVRAGVPVVASDLPEIRRVVARHRLGELYTPGDATDLAEAVRRVANDPAGYAQSLDVARRTLSWSVDAAVLTSAYATIGRSNHKEVSG